MYIGELIALVVAVAWTATALFAEVATKRIGQLTMNVLRMALSLLLLACTLLFTTGCPLPLFADAETWMWLSLSGFVGYVLGDYCLFNAYVVIGSRYAQLLMTLASPFAALAAWVLLGETLSGAALIGMFVCLTGIGMSVLAKGETANGSQKMALKLPLRGVLLGVGAGAGQGIGLVLSKMGMEHYSNLLAGADKMVVSMMPFACTMMRACAGLLCFSLVMIVTRQTHRLLPALRDTKAMKAGVGAVILGPFIGVSLSLMAVQMAPAGIAQTLMSLTPVLILLPTRMLYGTRITWMELAGAVLAVLGVSLFFLF